MSNDRKVAVITGANGMDARTLTHILLSKEYHVILTRRYNDSVDTDKIRASFDDDLLAHPQAKLSFAWLDLLCPVSIQTCVVNILREHGHIDEFYSLAAISQVGTSFDNFELTMRVNALAQQYILEALRLQSKDTRFYFACTSEIFGGNRDDKPYNESSVPDAKSPYAIAKNAGREIVQFYREAHGMYCVSGILFNHSNIYRKPYFFLSKVINGAIEATLGKTTAKLELGNVNFLRDEHLSDFGCEMMHRMLNNPHGPKDYVVGNGTFYHGTDFLDIAYDHCAGLDWREFVTLYNPAHLRKNEVVKLVADPSLACQELGWIPNRWTLEQIVESIFKYRLELAQGRSPKRPNPFVK